VVLPIYITSDATQDISHGIWKHILGSEKNSGSLVGAGLGSGSGS